MTAHGSLLRQSLKPWCRPAPSVSELVQSGDVKRAICCDRPGFHVVSVWRHFCTAREIARTAGITRARVTQIINLTQLAPEIQEAILDLEPTADHVPRFREREVRTIAIMPSWEKQRQAWKRIVKSFATNKAVK